jgi:hypothetical protein
VYDPAIEVRLTQKVKRAKKHIDELESILRAAGFPCRSKDFVRCENDPSKKERRYYCVKVPEIPADIPLITGDAIQNLRTALDHLACRLVGAIDRDTYFPIAQLETDYKALKSRRKIRRVRPKAAEYIDAFKPYKGGKYLLWELHELNKIDKHNLLLTVCATDVARSMTPSELAAFNAWAARNRHPAVAAVKHRHALKESETITPLKIGEKFLTVPYAEMDEEMKFLIDISFNEPTIFQSKTIVELLLKMHESVLGVIVGLSRGGVL